MAEDRNRAHDVLAAEEFAMPAPDPRLVDRDAHDVLAAEEFGMGSADPDLSGRVPRDVLAAEEFGVPAPDPGLTVSSEPMPLPLAPHDPRDSDPARDVLAAEGFAVPGAPPRSLPPGYGASQPPARWRPPRLLLVGALGVLAGLLRRRRRVA